MRGHWVSDVVRGHWVSQVVRDHWVSEVADSLLEVVDRSLEVVADCKRS